MGVQDSRSRARSRAHAQRTSIAGEPLMVALPLATYENVLKWLGRAQLRSGNRDVLWSLRALQAHDPRGGVPD